MNFDLGSGLNVSEMALNIPLPFWSMYLCKLVFLGLTIMKLKY